MSTNASQSPFMYSGIRVRSLARSIRFYRGLGFRTVKKAGFSHGGKWVHLAHPSSPHRIELNYYPKGTPFYEPFRPGTEFDRFGFFVSDPQEWIRQAVKAGGRPMTAFVDGPVLLAYVRDPDGVWLGCRGPSEPRGPPRKSLRKSRRRGGAD